MSLSLVVSLHALPLLRQGLSFLSVFSRMCRTESTNNPQAGKLRKTEARDAGKNWSVSLTLTLFVGCTADDDGDEDEDDLVGQST